MHPSHDVDRPMDRWGDAAVIGLGLFLTYLAAKTPWAATPLPLLVAASAVGTFALLARRRQALAVLIVAAVAFPASGNPWPVMVASFSAAALAAARPDGRRSLAVVALITALSYIVFNIIDEGRIDPNTFLGAGAVVVALVGAGTYTGVRSALVSALEERVARVETERLQHDELARSAERARIAREMHDVLAHKVSLIALHAGALEVNAAAGPDAVESGAALMRVTASEALDELRMVLGMLRPDAVGSADEADGPVDVRRLVAAWNEAGGTATLRDDVGPLPATTARAAARLVQEGLTNAHKHAPGSSVEVTVTGRPGRTVTVTVANDRAAGPHTDLHGSGMGLVGLQERLDLLGGQLQSGPTPEGGWRLEGTLPWSGTEPRGRPEPRADTSTETETETVTS